MKVMAVVVSVVLLVGCTTTPQGNQPQAIPDEATIRLLEEQERVGVLNRDTETLGRVWSEQLIVNSPLNMVATERAFALNAIRQGLIHYSLFERTIEHLRIDGDIAFVMGAETIQPTGNAPQAGQTVRRRFTHVWKREPAGWRLIARHANVIPGPR